MLLLLLFHSHITSSFSNLLEAFSPFLNLCEHMTRSWKKACYLNTHEFSWKCKIKGYGQTAVGHFEHFKNVSVKLHLILENDGHMLDFEPTRSRLVHRISIKIFDSRLDWRNRFQKPKNFLWHTQSTDIRGEGVGSKIFPSLKYVVQKNDSSVQGSVIKINGTVIVDIPNRIGTVLR